MTGSVGCVLSSCMDKSNARKSWLAIAALQDSP